MAPWWSSDANDRNWTRREQSLFDKLTHNNPAAQDDIKAAALFDKAWLLNGPKGEWQKARNALKRYLWEEYEIDVNDDMPWEEWRAWYTTS